MIRIIYRGPSQDAATAPSRSRLQRRRNRTSRLVLCAVCSRPNCGAPRTFGRSPNPQAARSPLPFHPLKVFSHDQLWESPPPSNFSFSASSAPTPARGQTPQPHRVGSSSARYALARIAARLVRWNRAKRSDLTRVRYEGPMDFSDQPF